MSTQNEKDYYTILDVGPAATLDQIRAARNLRLRFFHPDRFPHDPELGVEAERGTKGVKQAHEVLGEPSKRAPYDWERVTPSLDRDPLAEPYGEACSLVYQQRWRGGQEASVDS